MNRINGKDICLKIGTKFYAGMTQADWTSSTVVEKSLIKEDNGVELTEIIGFDDKFSITGIICINGTGDTATHSDWAVIRAAYRAKTAIPFAYGTGTTGTPEIAGNLLLLSLSEKTGSNGKATYSCDAEILQDATLTFATYA